MEKLKFDYSKLKGRIKEKNFTLNEFSNLIKISRTALYHKLEKDVEFTESEMFRICKVLNIEISDVNSYFFTPFVRIKER